MLGVKIGNIHTYDDWKLILTKVEKSFPEPKTETQEVPGMNGVLDLTESLSDDIKYKNRMLTLTFNMINNRTRWDTLLTEIENYLHGKKMQIILDSDKFYYYEGRCIIDKFSSNKAIGTLVIKCDVSPYKYELDTGGAWLWDTFNFRNSAIYKAKFTIDGTQQITIVNGREITSPTFVCDAPFTIKFGGVVYKIEAGTRKILDIRLREGNNDFIISGHGNLEIRFRRGML